ncbi:MAG: hypothetical protein RR319_01330 [Bacteroides sp.]
MGAKEQFEAGIKKAMAIKQKVLLNGLRDLMEACVEYAYDNHTFSNLTFNTQDSYGGAVYFKGKMYGNPYFLEQKASVGTIDMQVETDGQFGHEKSLDFLRSYKPKSEFDICVTTGTEYSEFLERVRHLDTLTGAFEFAKDACLMSFKPIK